MQPLYDPEAVRPMWEELAQCGVTPLQTAADMLMPRWPSPGTTMVSGQLNLRLRRRERRGRALPGASNTLIPDQLTTVFAGVDMEATARARELMPNVQPSSPSVAIFKDGTPVYVLERRHD